MPRNWSKLPPKLKGAAIAYQAPAASSQASIDDLVGTSAEAVLLIIIVVVFPCSSARWMAIFVRC